ncbi:putative quinol monooxygenase [Rufibacter roseus]|uniref:Quinol monooxygenase n=1 Tax=Rufibacter roseus TaxID=1567108 RepID=A0ABW2DMQ1_9BACT|nr:putative quinol monooxygenase [Rufibacter roseus]
MEKYALFGKLMTQPGKRDELLAILTQAAQLVATAKGCHHYIVYKDAQHQDWIWVSEIWDSEADHDNSLQIEGVMDLISQAMPLLAGRPEKIEMTVVGGKGIS